MVCAPSAHAYAALTLPHQAPRHQLRALWAIAVTLWEVGWRQVDFLHRELTH